MGLLGDLVKSTVDAGLGMISSAWQNKLNKNASEQAFKNQLYGSKELARFQAYDLPEIAMSGYKKAGINPIVAYGGLSSSSMPSMSVSAARQEAPDFGAVFSRATARRELDLRERIADLEQKRADRLADAKIADMKEGRRIQERGINNSGMSGLLKFLFGEESQGKLADFIYKHGEPIFDFLYGNSSKDNKSLLRRFVEWNRMGKSPQKDWSDGAPPFKQQVKDLYGVDSDKLSLKFGSSARRFKDFMMPHWYHGYDWNSPDARMRARMRRYEQDRKELKK